MSFLTNLHPFSTSSNSTCDRNGHKWLIGEGFLANRVAQTVEDQWGGKAHFLLLTAPKEQCTEGGLKRCKRAQRFELSGTFGQPVARLVTKSAKYFPGGPAQYEAVSATIPKCIERSNIALERLKDVDGIIRQQACLQTTHKDGTIKYVLFQNWCSRGDLLDHLSGLGSLSPATKNEIVFMLLETLSIMHALGVYHRDLKLDNILLDLSDNLIKPIITDFDMAYTSSLEDQPGIGLEDLGERCGSMLYLAPERAKAFWDLRVNNDRRGLNMITEEDLARNDVWAMGLIFHCLYQGKFPVKMRSAISWEKKNPSKALEFLKNMEGQMVSNTTDPMHRLISEMLCTDPMVRLTAKEAFERFQDIYSSLPRPSQDFL